MCKGWTLLPLGLVLGLSSSAQGAEFFVLVSFLGRVIAMENVRLRWWGGCWGQRASERRRNFWALAGKDWTQQQARSEDSSITL